MRTLTSGSVRGWGWAGRIWPCPVDKCEGCGWAGLTQGTTIKVGGLDGRARPGPTDESAEVGPGWLASRSGGWGCRPVTAGQPSLANHHVFGLTGWKGKELVTPCHAVSLLSVSHDRSKLLLRNCLESWPYVASHRPPIGNSIL